MVKVKEYCQACGKEISWNDKTIEVRYGWLNATKTDRIDYFHQTCHAKVGILGV